MVAELVRHPVLRCVATLEAALKDVADVDPVFMTTGDKAEALTGLSRAAARLAELRMRVLAAASDVAEADAARDAGVWLAYRTRCDRGTARRELALAEALTQRWTAVTGGLREGSLNQAQADTIVRALDALPDRVEAEVKAAAEERLVAEAAVHGPRELRAMGRRILDLVAPEVSESEEGRRLAEEDRNAQRRTYLTYRRNGDGTTDIRARVSDLLADRLLTYLNAFTAPRKSKSTNPDDRRPYEQKLGAAFGSFLEAVDPNRLPLHGGDATTLIVTIDLDRLRDQLAGIGLVGDEPISAAQARRLACTAKILPAVLGGKSEPLDLGRARRLFSPAQRKAMAIRDRTCRAAGCTTPAAWCEAHHRNPWSRGGKTDLADGVLLCPYHHHRAHDPSYACTDALDGRLIFHRRR